MTRLGDLLDFGHLFQAFGNNCIAQITHILDIFCKGVKIIHLPCEIIFGQLLKTFGNFLLVTLLPTKIFRSIELKFIGSLSISTYVNARQYFVEIFLN